MYAHDDLSIVDSINKMKLFELHFDKVDFDKKLLEESEFLKKISVLEASGVTIMVRF